MNFEKFARQMGVHPLIGFGLFAIDFMMFAAEGATLGRAMICTIPIGLLLMIPTVLIQKNSFNESWGAAIGKGMLLGILTAIPTPLPGVASIGAGILGNIALSSEKEKISGPAPSYKVYEDIADEDEVLDVEIEGRWREVDGKYSTM